MRGFGLRHVICIAVTVSCACAQLSPVRADTPAPPSAPTNLKMFVSGVKQVQNHDWIAASELTVRFGVQTSTGSLTPEVELEPFHTPFKGEPNFTGASVAASGTGTVVLKGLSNGQTYHLQARVTDSSGLNSPWTTFSAGDTKPNFGVDKTAPSRPTISSSSNRDQNRWYHNSTVSLSWSSVDAISGVKGYSYLLERVAGVIPPGSITSQTRLKLRGLSDGVWFVALRSVDEAGNWSPTATYRLLLDRQAPRVTWLSPSRFTFNPYRGPTSVKFTTTKDVRLKLALYRVGNRSATRTYFFSHLQGGRVTTITWSGKDAKGHPVARGYYFFSVKAVDRAANVGVGNLGGIFVDPEQAYRAATGQVLFPGDGKRIIVSLSRETLYAYDGVKLLLQTYVTTGNPNLPTPLGTFTVIARYHPYQFISPWPRGSPYYYPPSLSQYAMLFREGGYFLHDAPWRGVFGPGSNGPGQPGSNFGGTHGCVNIPPTAMLFLWNWTPVGTTVQVVS